MVDSYEDVADEVDEFHLQRDKVLLDGSTGAGRKGGRDGKGREGGEESEVEEVWGLGSDEDDDDGEEDLEQYATSDEDGGGEGEGEGEGENIGRRRGNAGLSDGDDEEVDEEEDIEGWGTSKSAYYGGNEDEIETEQDALDEGAEARRIQKKQLAAMDTTDFMLDLEEWGTGAPSTKTTTTTTTTKLTTTTETLPTEISEDLSPEERLSLLKTRNPEFEPLSAEFLELQRIYPVLAAQAEKGGEVGVIRYKALAAYLGVLAMYFALLAREKGGSWGGVKEHGVMKGLVRCRGLWERVKGLQEEGEEGGEDNEEGDVEMVDGVGESEDDEDEGDEEEEEEEVSSEPVRKQLSKVAISREITNGKAFAPRKRAKLDLDIDIPSTTSKSTKSLPPKTATDLSDLSSLIPTTTITTKSTTKKPTKPTKPTNTSDFSDPTTLSHADLSEKQSRKSSLRFHAAQLLSKSALRAQAGRHAGGDTDLPRKDKHPERSSLTTVKRDQNLGDDLDLEGPTEQDNSTAKEVNGSNDNDDLEYYNSLAAKSRKAKRAENAVGGEFARFEEEGDMEGKRAIGYTIEKNKGLTPHRKKDVRNPRVKKRKAYEKAKKKLRTVKRVYSGGQQGAYGGEMTGIKKCVVRSTKLK